MTHLFIAVPCYGGNLQVGFTQSLLALQGALSANGISHEIEFVSGESLINRARNNLVWAGLKSPMTNFMFIDADIDFAPEDVITLLRQQEENGYDILGAAYPTKDLNVERLVQIARTNPELPPERVAASATRMAIDPLKPIQEVFETDTGCIEVRHLATGFMMVRRPVFEQIAKARPELMYLCDEVGPNRFDPRWDFFQVRVGNFGFSPDMPHLGRMLSEDYAFCDLWRSLGGKVWLNVDIQLGHTGAFRYTGELAAKMYAPIEIGDVEWLDIVDDINHPHRALHIQRYQWAARFIKNCKVANAACGSNYGAAILEDSGCAVTGFDFDKAALAVAERDGLVPVVLGDITATNLDGFEALVSLETLEHLERPFDWLKSLSPSVTKMVSSVPIVPTMHFNKFHKHDFTEETFLTQLMAAGWNPRETWVQSDDVLMVYAERSR